MMDTHGLSDGMPESAVRRGCRTTIGPNGYSGTKPQRLASTIYLRELARTSHDPSINKTLALLGGSQALDAAYGAVQCDLERYIPSGRLQSSVFGSTSFHKAILLRISSVSSFLASRRWLFLSAGNSRARRRDLELRLGCGICA